MSTSKHKSDSNFTKIKCRNEFFFPIEKVREAGFFWFCQECPYKFECGTGSRDWFEYHDELIVVTKGDVSE